MDKTGNLAEVRGLYEALVLSKERVLQSLVYSEDLMPEQSKVVHFLKAYIGSMDDELLHFSNNLFDLLQPLLSAPKSP